MKKLFLLSVAAMFICSLSFATIRRVGFFGPAVSGVDYSSLQLAHDASAAGDTIMMIPGASTVCSITKGLVIIGPGFFLNPADATFPGNAGLQANINSTASLGPISFGAGSSNTQIIGCSIYYLTFDSPSLANILIKRSYLSFPNYSVLFNASASNVTFQQCVFNGVVSGSQALNNISFLNCLFVNTGYIQFSGATSGLINNCIFSYSNAGFSFGAGGWQVSNSINKGSAAGTNVAYTNNIGTGVQFPAGNGNQQNVPWASIFNLIGSYDGQYALKVGSPAIGAGINGAAATDCGIFGGATPYRLSGIPSVPAIYALTSPQGTIPAGNTVQINLSTRSNN